MKRKVSDMKLRKITQRKTNSKRKQQTRKIHTGRKTKERN
jgi:hypothetical protein